MSYIVGDGVGTEAALRLKMLFLHVIIYWWNLAGIDTAFRRQKFYKGTSGKSIGLFKPAYD